MHEQNSTMTTARLRGWLFLLGGILMLGISISAYLYPRGQLRPTDWIIYFAAGVSALVTGSADVFFANMSKLRRWIKTIALLCWVGGLIFVIAQRWF
jgi:hypothetical protein